MCKNNYIVQQGYECLSACLSNCFNQKKIKITGSDIFLLGDGCNVLYRQKDMEIGTDIYIANYNFMNFLGLKYINDTCDNEQKYFLSQCVKNRYGLCIKVGSKYLEYNRVFSQSDNSPHFINILDVNDDRVLICDGYVPEREATTFSGWLDLEKIVQAWKSMNYEYVLLKDVSMVRTNNIKSVVLEKMQRSINAYIKGGKDAELYYGKDAILQLNRDIKKVFESSDAKEKVKNINYQLKIYGFISSKIMLLDSISRYVPQISCTKEYKEIINNWNRYCILLIKSALSQRKEGYERTYNKCEEFVDRECDVLSKILRKM